MGAYSHNLAPNLFNTYQNWEKNYIAEVGTMPSTEEKIQAEIFFGKICAGCHKPFEYGETTDSYFFFIRAWYIGRDGGRYCGGEINGCYFCKNCLLTNNLEALF